MLIIGCDFHPGFQQVAIFDNRTGEIQEKRLQHRAEAEQFYRATGGPGGAGGDGGLRTLSVVRAVAGGDGDRAVDGGCGAGAGFGGTAAEDGPAGRGASAAVAAGRSVSADLGAEPGGAGCAAVAGASAQAGAGADAHQEPVAVHGAEPWGAEEVQAVDARRGERSWSSCPCCRTRRSGESGCWKRSTGWKRRSSNWTGE